MRLGLTISLCVGALGFFAAVRGHAAELGDPAPALKIGKWIKGDAVDLEKTKGKKVVVVEFWATWCPPCRASIPHLSDLARKYREKDVVIVGVTNEQELDKVTRFVENMGEKMDYVVAQDEGRATFKQYMEAFGQRGIPHAFVVNKKGQIAWHGHPMADLDAAIEAVVSGTHSIEEARAEARRMAEMRERSVKLLGTLRDYFQLVNRAEALGDQLLEEAKGNADVLNAFAWRILTDPGVRARDLDLALRVARAAYDASDGKNAAIVDTYARALWDTGEKVDAVKLQKKAVSLCTNSAMKADLEKTLEEYQKALEEKPVKPAETAEPGGRVRL